MAWVALAGAAISAYSKTNEAAGLRTEETANGATFSNQFDASGWVVNTGGGSVRDLEVSGSNQSQPVTNSPSAGKAGATLLPNEFSAGGDNTLMLAAGGVVLIVVLLMLRRKKKK